MFHESLSDPTAGQRAQRSRLEPGVAQPILDPTDPRYGSTPTPQRDVASDEPREPATPHRPAPAA